MVRANKNGANNGSHGRGGGHAGHSVAALSGARLPQDTGNSGASSSSGSSAGTGAALSDSVKLPDGTVLPIARSPEVDPNTWEDIKTYLECNPEIAKNLRNFSKNPKAMRGWLQIQALADHYHLELEAGDSQRDEVFQQLENLEQDEELRQMLEEVRRNGMRGAMQHWRDEELLLKLSDRMGGVPPEAASTLQKIEETPLSLHEAARNGDCKCIAEYLRKGTAVDSPDDQGITALGHAAGHGRLAAVQALLASRADPSTVDAEGSSGLHYAAGYGCKEVVEFLCDGSFGLVAARVNAHGHTPAALAAMNGHTQCVQLLEACG